MQWLSRGIITTLIAAHLVFWGVFISRTHILLPQQALPDFDAYMTLVSGIRDGHDPYTVPTLQTVGPPNVFLIYLPFSFLPHSEARVILTLFSILCGYLTCFVMVRSWRTPWKIQYFLLLSLIFFLAFPVRFSLTMGQPNTVLALLVASLFVYRSILATSILVALLVLLKPIFAPVLLWQAAWRHRSLLPTVCYMIGIFFWSLTIIPLPTWETYLTHKAPAVVGSMPQATMDYYNQSLRSTVTRLELAELYLPIFILVASGIVWLITGLPSLIPAVAGGLLLSPISWQHYMVVLYPLVLSLLYPLTPKRFFFFTCFLGVWFLDLPSLHTASIGGVLGILGSHWFLAALVVCLWVWVEGRGARKRT